ncbi:hypothetical protein HGB07_00015 [Candidatus Roizmanbacteria bacterium]|nr:hypothetical protein [Candidatus Roizmanbacteria bacterium]
MSNQQDNKTAKQALAVPETVLLSTQERIEFIANLIADRIAADEAEDFVLLKKIKAVHGTKQIIA